MLRKSLYCLIVILLVAGCSANGAVPEAPATALPVVLPDATQTEESGTSLTLTDGLGRTVRLEKPAERIISLAPSNTEILFAVGAGAQVIGRDLFSDYPADAQALPVIGGDMGAYDLEAIVALQPDLVLAGGINPPELVLSLEELGLSVYFLPNPVTLEEMFTNLETVAALAGTQAQGAELVAALQARVAAVDAAILPLSYAPIVYYEIDATNPATPYTYGPGSFGDTLIRRAGGISIGASLVGEWAPISLEAIVAADPTYVLLGDAAWGETPEKFASRPGMGALMAVKNGQVFAFDDNLISRPGPRQVDGLEALARLLHPGVVR